MMQEEEEAIFAEFDEIAGGDKAPAEAAPPAAEPRAELPTGLTEPSQADADPPPIPSDDNRAAGREMN